MGSSSGRFPPGFRFSPTDEELIVYYLKRKITRRRLQPPVLIGDVDVYKSDPWDLPHKSVLQNGDKQWYFFSPRDRKYPNGSRANRTSMHGYWKATGKDRTICQNSMPVGSKKTLVYYHGKAPKGERTDWVMYEYLLDEQAMATYKGPQDPYALYKVFMKSGPGPKNGEQYGATFREEEWEDAVDDSFFHQNYEEDVLHDNYSVISTVPVSEGTNNALPMDDLEDLLMQISAQEDTLQQDFFTSVPEIDAGEYVGNSEAMPSFMDIPLIGEESTLFDPTMGVNTELVESDFPNVLAIEDPEVTGVASGQNKGRYEVDEEFLEIRDFIAGEPTQQGVEQITTKDLSHGNYETFIEYFDAPLFLAEQFQPSGAVAENHFSEFNYGGVQDQALYFTSELWTHDQATTIASTSMERSHHVTSLPTPGAQNVNTTENGETTLGQVTQGPSSSESWLNSALLALLDSVPNSPALAAENPLISRAFKRVSSFRTQGDVKQETSSRLSGEPSDAGMRGRKGSRLVVISLLVALIAVFFALTSGGAAVSFFKGLWRRSVPSST